eukprot:m.123944 g.123944  ORF g.123944 m.123944 type:complete len:195 (+) comp15581_c2_seq1:372-956(+)
MVFNDSSAIRQAAATCSSIPAAQLKTMLNRVFSRLLTKQDAFSASEKQQLADNFELPLADIQLLIETLTFMVQTAAYHQLSEKAMTKHLLNVGFSEDHTSMFASIWGSKASNIIETLRESAFFNTQLQNVTWGLDVQVADDTLGPTARPNIKLQLDLAKGPEEKEIVTIGMTHEELAAFYEKLETIQAQLDQLS